MLTASRALTVKGHIGEPLPDLPVLADFHGPEWEYRPRGGQVTMIVGQPGSQKSGLALHLAGEWGKVGVPTLYFSADMDQHTAITRLAASITGDRTRDVADGVESGNGAYYSDAVGDVSVRFVFDTNPTMTDIMESIDAWVELYDSYPGLIVLDNLLDVEPTAGDSEHSGYKSILLDVKELARGTGAHVFVLHHASEAGTNPNAPAPRSAVMGKVSQTPENVLSVAMDQTQQWFMASLVKHRNGPSDATAKRLVSMHVDPSRNRFERYTPAAQAWEGEKWWN